MKKVISILLLLGLITSVVAQSKFTTNVLEFSGALGGTACCFGTGGLLFYLILMWGVADLNASLVGGEGSNVPGGIQVMVGLASISAIALTPASAAFGVCRVGKRINPGGSYWKSFLGAVCGTVAGAGLGLGTGYIVDRALHNSNFYWAILPGAILGNSFGAVIGYNLSVPKWYEKSFFHQHLSPPGFSIKTEKDNNQMISIFDLRLINAKF